MAWLAIISDVVNHSMPCMFPILLLTLSLIFYHFFYLQFYDIGGTKVIYYYGLDVVCSPDHVSAAGPHVGDSAVGVLMPVLDQHKIHERPGV